MIWRCGTNIAPGIRHFCRLATCYFCLRCACEKRAADWLDKVGSGALLLAFRTGRINDFDAERRRLHDAVKHHRRGLLARPWKWCSLICRLDERGRLVGIVAPGGIGTDDLADLLRPSGHFEPVDTDDVVALLLGDGTAWGTSMKAQFLTINPARGPRKPPMRAPRFREPMPVL